VKTNKLHGLLNWKIFMCGNFPFALERLGYCLGLFWMESLKPQGKQHHFVIMIRQSNRGLKTKTKLV